MLALILEELSLIIAAIVLNDGQTNAIEGTTHFVLFSAFLMLAFMGLQTILRHFRN